MHLSVGLPENTQKPPKQSKGKDKAALGSKIKGAHISNWIRVSLIADILAPSVNPTESSLSGYQHYNHEQKIDLSVGLLSPQL